MSAHSDGVQLCCEEFRMLDVIYILIGAAFLAGCGLYAIACEHL
jgi:hypothetical protein